MVCNAVLKEHSFSSIAQTRIKINVQLQKQWPSGVSFAVHSRRTACLREARGYQREYRGKIERNSRPIVLPQFPSNQTGGQCGYTSREKVNSQRPSAHTLADGFNHERLQNRLGKRVIKTIDCHRNPDRLLGRRTPENKIDRGKNQITYRGYQSSRNAITKPARRPGCERISNIKD